MTLALLETSKAERRITCAKQWLVDRAPGEEVLVVAATPDAANELLRAAAAECGAAFGWQRLTLGRLAAALAAPALVEQSAVPIGRLAAEAVAARVVHGLARAGSLGRYAGVGKAPGFSRAAAGTLEELRLAGADPGALRRAAPELRAIFHAYEAELGRAGLADRARVFALAAETARAADGRQPLLGLPTLLLDVPVQSAAECELVAAVAARAPQVLATLPSGDGATWENLRALGFEPQEAERGTDDSGPDALRNLQTHLFEGTAPVQASLDETVVLLSAPGESRECVEIARRLLEFARGGIGFDRMAILLRSPAEYRPHLEEALGRAGIPAHFARGAVQADPAGRAFLALLGCAAEGLSARRFAEYLSLGEVPDATPEGTPPPAPAATDRWVAPDEELVPEVVAETLSEAATSPGAESDEQSALVEDGDAAPVAAGTLRAPRRWERLLVDAAVIGGRERWERRLRGLERELHLDLDALDDPDDPAAQRIWRSLADLCALRAYALPLLDSLAALPKRASWGVWLDALSELAARALRHPERVLSVLAELAPMAAVGPVDLSEVQLVLSPRLLELAVKPGSDRYGRVFVAAAEAARGLSFEVVCVPGLAEKLFPRSIREEPILLDATRQELRCGLVTNEDRVMRERLHLRLAAGAARRRLLLSYPRLDLEKARSRVPSFYSLEAMRAAEGKLPGFDELATRAEIVAAARVGWPAPARPEDAIDDAEHDLALLESLRRLDPEKSVGTARYLLAANPHLGRALRFRARRWLAAWTVADGLVPPSKGELAPGTRDAIRAHALSARSYSPTALQNYASCPYKFFLYAVHRLAPREVPEAIDEMDPLQRGSLVHDAQFEFFRRLAAKGLLPLRPANRAQTLGILDEVLDQVAERYREELAPAIDRVWEDGIAAIRADLREWLRRLGEDGSGFVPWRFELSFGLPERRLRDPHSVEDPVALDCGIALRGSIDLIERAGGIGDARHRGRRGGERLRVTDHKTGKHRLNPGAVIAGGEALQPVFYALAAEKLFPSATVESGRLSYCTSAGGFAERIVPLDASARESAQTLAQVVGEALAEPFLPAAPAKDACRWCDYRVVCGPYEELRTGRKWQPRLEALGQLRDLP